MIKKFSDIKKPVRRINKQDRTPIRQDDPNKTNLPENIEGSSSDSNDSECNPAKLFSKLFESREMAHIYHLQVKGDMGSHAKHTALNEYYDGISELVDLIIEVYTGQYGIIEEYDVIDTKGTKSKDAIEYFNELAKFIKDERTCINEEDTHIHNIIDEVVTLVYRTLYKLKYTK